LDAKINGTTTTLNDYNWQDAWHYAIGGTYEIDQQSNIDIGLTYLIGEDVQADEVTDAGPIELSRISATTRANAVLFGLQYNRTF